MNRNQDNAPSPTIEPSPDDHPNVPFFPPVLPLGGLVLGVVLEKIVPLNLLSSQMVLPLRFGLAGCFLLPGLAIFIGSGRAMRRARTNVNPKQPTLALVRTWPFSLSRNPMYLGGNLLYLGIAVAFDLGWMLLLFPVVAFLCHYLVVLREEAYLARKFGAEYATYQSQVRRWL